ncbi:MAG: LD-carboxypeptidase [Bacteroidales bacterium]|nr:LD-carboxypeptidase [Bacteroidales bacterium]
MKRPPSLQFNDRAVILSPAGKIDGYVVQDAAAILDHWELCPEISQHALCEVGRFSGSIAQRLSDLQKAFDDPKVKLILCSRGGFGAVHLLEKLNFSGIKKNPKWVVGYSDITLLHAALLRCGVASLHGPMAQHFSDEGAEDIAVRYTKSVLSGQSLEYQIPVGESGFLNRKGKSRGKLFGGNLSIFCSLLGTKYMRIPRGGILFIEDIGEPPYRVDRMIYQLKLAGIFRKISGLIVGQFTDYSEDHQMYYSLKESIREAVSEYDFPLCFNFPVGHVKLNFPMIVGESAILKVEENFISFKQ